MSAATLSLLLLTFLGKTSQENMQQMWMCLKKEDMELYDAKIKPHKRLKTNALQRGQDSTHNYGNC